MIKIDLCWSCEIIILIHLLDKLYCSIIFISEELCHKIYIKKYSPKAIPIDYIFVYYRIVTK